MLQLNQGMVFTGLPVPRAERMEMNLVRYPRKGSLCAVPFAALFYLLSQFDLVQFLVLYLIRD